MTSWYGTSTPHHYDTQSVHDGCQYNSSTPYREHVGTKYQERAGCVKPECNIYVCTYSCTCCGTNSTMTVRFHFQLKIRQICDCTAVLRNSEIDSQSIRAHAVRIWCYTGGMSSLPIHNSAYQSCILLLCYSCCYLPAHLLYRCCSLLQRCYLLL